MIKTKMNKRIITKDAKGMSNGFLVPIVNVHEDFPDCDHFPKQVYLTVADVGTAKGPHLHMKRWGLFTCIRGNVKVVVKTVEGYKEYFSGEDYNYATVQVPAGCANMLVNIGDEACYILNMPSPAWHVDDQDDWPVEAWDYPIS